MTWPRARCPHPARSTGRFASEPWAGITSLKAVPGAAEAHNGSVALALAIGDTVKRIDGTEVPLTTPWQGKPAPTGGETEFSKRART
jgi:NADH-quinone oxidoreductase subunit E